MEASVVAPTSAPDLLSASDSGISNSDNITNLRQLDFTVAESRSMFPSIALTQKYDPDGTVRQAVDAGLLAEAMLYYDEVTVIANHVVFRDLLRQCTPTILRECMEAGHLKVKYLDNAVGINTSNSGTFKEIHSPLFISAPRYAWNKFGSDAVAEVLGCSGKGAKRFIRTIKDWVEPTLLSDDIRIGTLEDFSNGGYIAEAASILLKEIVPSFNVPDNFVFDVHRLGDSFKVDTNLNFDAVNIEYHKVVSPKHSSITPALLLAHIQGARQDWFFASQLESEISTDSVRSAIYKLKFNDLISSRRTSSDQIEVF